MSLSVPVNPPTVNEAVAKTSSNVVSSGIDENQTRVNQIQGNTSNNSQGAGIPKQVTNAQVSIANAAAGSTCTVTVVYKADPTDKSLSGVNVWVKGYQGNNNPVLIGSGTSSPTKIVLNNTGEIVSFIIQAFGNGGNAPFSLAPTCSGTLPKSSSGGFGSSAVTSGSATLQTNGVANGSQSKLNLKNGNNVTITDDGSGGDTIATNGVILNSTGIGYILGPGLLRPPIAADLTNVSICAVANTVYLFQFVLPIKVTLTRCSWFIGGLSAGKHFSFGIYDSSGNKVVDSGVFTIGSTGIAVTNSFGAVTLNPGVYWLAQTDDVGTTSGPGANMPNSGTTAVKFFNAYQTHMATAANPSVAGALPATTGVRTAFSAVSPPSIGTAYPLWEP